jgi:putative transcriptional regulator
MNGRIANRFRVLLAEKATREQHSIAINDVQRETGIAWSTLNSWANNQVTRYDAPVIQALCEYFNCQVGDLLIYKQENSQVSNK